ncbi:MAG TPA: dihydrolipoamide acetyltransferase family protein [Tepidiformaceae bacterium]|nr:dihydrolipoamide acetyltransferase family protein [Tepidiformaceae bacterium]HMO95575.1 dihydrolipoamide acetyltransferase family protein [Tepidiformaceae bacterium]
MAFEVTMPQMGADMTEGTLLKWLKQPGEAINRGDVLAEIETDKATVELEAYESGTLLKHVAAEGDVVPVGDVVALIGAASEAAEEPVRKPPAETPARRTIEPEAKQAAASSTAVKTAPKQAEAESNGRIRISPVAKRIASENKVDIAALVGSGPDGRILRRDVEAAIAGAAAPEPETEAPAAERETATAPKPAPAPQRPAPRAGEVQQLSRMRQAIARRMTLSKQNQPHYYLTLDVDMTDALAFREMINGSATPEQKVSINDLVVKACAIALARHPKFNAAFTDEGLKVNGDINICIGIALDEGLIAPALLECQSKSLGRIAIEAKDLINRAKDGKLSADEYSEGTFTITNLGAYGVETLIGIINPPQAAILGVGSVLDQPVVRGGEIVARKVMKLALSADHRVTDGAEGARFIKEIQGLLEKPASLAL